MSSTTAIAIIGLSGAFPGAANVKEFWAKISAGEELIHFLPRENVGDDHGTASQHRHTVPAVSCMEGIDLFDAKFFGMSPAEAELTDPQHRILLQHAWSALENAGYDSNALAKPVGVFAGATTNTYLVHNLASHAGWLRSVDPIQLNIGNGVDFLTTRISYKLNLHGPSHAVQSACSTSLVAVHCACRSLLDLECDMALAGGVSINVTLSNGYDFIPGGVLSPDGHCRPFDHKARGTVFGSGVGVVVLKRLDDALADGDFIHAVIRGSAVNNDGIGRAGFTAPGVDGQARVIVEALSAAGVPPESISYIECHGTGTAVGDPIEVRALQKAYGAVQGWRCALGSVKGNVGHLDAAAGVTGLIKAVMSLRYRTLAPSLHYEAANPQIDWGGSGFYVNTKLQRWDGEGPMRAGVSAFGVGGTNAHVVLEEAPERAGSGEVREEQLLVLSSRTEKGLKGMGKAVAAHLGEHEEQGLEEVAYTLQVGRHPFGLRHSMVSGSREEAIEQLQGSEEWEAEEQEEAGTGVVYLFPGQGAQQEGMGRELYVREREFRRQVEECSEILRGELGVEISKLVKGEGEEGWRREMEETWLVQPWLVAVEYSLARMWMGWGVRAEAMIGHSLGEYTAACVSGVMTIEEGLKLVAGRGRLMQGGERGAMLAVGLGKEEVEEYLEGGEVWVAAINGAESCTVAGSSGAIEELKERLKRRQVGYQHLATSHAFHSGLVEPVMERFEEEVRKVKLRAPEIRFISNVSGEWIKAEEAQDVKYWVRQMRAPVQFHQGVGRVMEEVGGVWLEVGPGQGLRRLVLRHRQAGRSRLVAATMPTPGRREQRQMLESLGRMWERGVKVDWEGFQAEQKRHRVPLPTYRFEPKRFWIDPASPLIRAPLPEQSVDPAVESVADVRGCSERPLLRNSYAPPQTDLERTIVKTLEKALGTAPIGIDDKFGELGGDSLLAVRVVNEINQSLNSDLRAVDLYEGLTARELATLLHGSSANATQAQPVLPTLNQANAGLQRRAYVTQRRSERTVMDAD